MNYDQQRAGRCVPQQLTPEQLVDLHRSNSCAAVDKLMGHIAAVEKELNDARNLIIETRELQKEMAGK
jgi:hypothetical protein